MDINLETIESLIKLMTANRVDCIELGELKILKIKHDPVKADKDNVTSKKSIFTEEEVLFHSTTNALTLQQIEELEAGTLVINPTKG